jgi:hypothetical protein
MKKYIFNVSLVLISLFVVIALGELILRIIRPAQIVHTGREFNFYSFDHTYGWKGKPDAVGSFSRYGEYHVRVKNNSDGMRDREYPVEKKCFRMAVMGDSYTWGFGVEQDEIFMEILEREYFKNIEVFNLGISGYSTVQSYLLFLELDAKYNFDFALFFYNTGDFKRNVKADDNGYAKPYAVTEEGALVFKGLPVREAKPVHHGLKSKLYIRKLVSLVKAKLTGKIISLKYASRNEQNYGYKMGDIPVRTLNDGRYDYAYGITKEIFREIKKYCEGEGIKLVVMLNTAAWQFDDIYKEKAADAFKGDRWRVDWELPQKKMEIILSGLKIPCLNLLPVLQKEYSATKKDPHFKIDGHYNPDGHMMIAKILQEFLKEENSLDGRHWQ